MPDERRLAPRGDVSRTPDEEGNVKRRLVREESVRQLAVVPDGLPVVSRDDQDQGPAARPKVVPERSQSGIHSRDLAQVGIAGEDAVERRGGIVRGMAVVDVDPEEPRTGGNGGEPPARASDDLRRRPFRDAEPVAGRPLGIVLIVDVETAGQPETGIERIRPDEGRRGESPRLEKGCERGHVVAQPEAGCCAHAVLIGIETREDVDVRGERDDVLGGVLEDGASAARRSVGPFPASLPRNPPRPPEGVDRDEHDVRRRPGERRPLPAAHEARRRPRGPPRGELGPRLPPRPPRREAPRAFRSRERLTPGSQTVRTDYHCRAPEPGPRWPGTRPSATFEIPRRRPPGASLDGFQELLDGIGVLPFGPICMYLEVAFAARIRRCACLFFVEPPIW